MSSMRRSTATPEHEVLPVRSGYRLCLTYNLVVSAGSTKVPSAGSNHVYYAQVEMALHKFFTSKSEDSKHPAKRRRLNGDLLAPATIEPRDVRLVSVLDHKYTDGGLAFALHKGRDRIVAESLARFCNESNGMFGLYLAKVKYSEITNGMDEEEEDEDEEKTLDLLKPWIKYGSTSTKAVDFAKCSASLYGGVVPTGFFSNITFDGEDPVDEEYMGNEGSLVEQWYKTAAPIFQPLNVEVSQSMRYTSKGQKVDMLMDLVRSASPLARTFCQSLLQSQKFYSCSDDDFGRCLDAVGQLQSQEMFQQLLSGLLSFSSQPLLPVTAQKLGWSSSVATLAAIGKTLSFSGRVGLLLCATEGITDVPQLKELLDSLDFKPVLSSNSNKGSSYSGYGRFRSSFQADEPHVDGWASQVAKLLVFANRILWEEVVTLVDTNSADVLVQLIAPALVEFTKSLPPDQRPPERGVHG